MSKCDGEDRRALHSMFCPMLSTLTSSIIFVLDVTLTVDNRDRLTAWISLLTSEDLLCPLQEALQWMARYGLVSDFLSA